MSDVTSFEVTGDWRHIVDDGMVDLDDLPDEVLPTGTVKFTPMFPTVATAGVPATAYTFGQVPALIAGGVLTDLQGRPGVRLAGKVGEHTVRWNAEINLTYQGQKVAYPSPVAFELEADTVLSAIIQQAGRAMTPIVLDPRIEALAGRLADVDQVVGQAEQIVVDAGQSVVDAKAHADRAEGLAVAQDEHVADVLADPASATHAAFKAVGNATYGRKMIVDANQHGVKADGVTDDHPAWQALVNSLEDTGATITWTGRSMVEAPILWKRGVNLIGQGWGKSVLATRGDVEELPFGAIEGFSPYASTSNPYEDLLFKDFEVDGSELAYPGPSISGKALFIQFMRRCQFVNLYLHDTIGTALGIDFLPDCLIQGVIVVNGGRGWTGAEGGHAGIGIGMGAWPEENITISDCHTINCGHWGIFVERQNEQPYRSRGAKIIGCTATGTRGTGIADVGCTNTIIANCTATGNGTMNHAQWRDGFCLMYGTVGAMVTNNVSSDNAFGEGIFIRSDVGDNHTISGNKVLRNGRRGIVFSAENGTRRGITIRDNEVANNQFDGIAANSGASGSLPDLMVAGNRCYDNGKAGQVGADRGINIGANVSGGMIDGNRCYDTQATKTQQYGIALPSGTFTNTTLVGNNIVGNAAAGIVTTGATLTSLTRRANVGYLTENRGSASIAAGAATVTVVHGMTAPPTSVQVTPRTGGDPIWVTTIGASGFIVNRAEALSSAGVDFTWTAEL